MAAYWDGDCHNLFIGNWKEGQHCGYMKAKYANGETFEGLFERNFYRETKEEIETYDPDHPDNAALVSKVDFDKYIIYHPKE